jgi:hypothetical protein
MNEVTTGVKPIADRLKDLIEEINSMKELYQRRDWLTTDQFFKFTEGIAAMEELAKTIKRMHEYER